MAAPTFTSASNASTDGTFGTTWTTLSCGHTVAAGDCLVVYVYHVSGQSSPCTSMTWNGAPMNKIIQSTWHFGAFYFLMNPIPATANIVGNWSTGSKGLVMMAASFAGATNLTFGSALTQGVTTSITTSNTALLPSTVLIDFGVSGDYQDFGTSPPAPPPTYPPNPHTQGSGQTQMLNFTSLTQASGGGHLAIGYQNSASYKNGGAVGASDAMSFTHDSAGDGIVTVILNSIDSPDAQPMLL